MFGLSLIRTKKLTAVYEWLAKLVTDKVRNQNTLKMEIKGKIIQNLGIQSGTSKAGKAWSKASILIETEGQYPKKVVLDNLKNADEFSKLAVGSTGTFHIEINSNEYNGRWYTSVSCWKWQLDRQPQQSTSATPTLDSMGVTGYQGQNTQTAPQEEDSDLPF
ncbi:MAG: DUF3127 domain-containing protein [Bacteroides sp.]|nr:DUF3127 domain-containing protein [Bacteroides sp.]